MRRRHEEYCEQSTLSANSAAWDGHYRKMPLNSVASVRIAPSFTHVINGYPACETLRSGRTGSNNHRATFDKKRLARPSKRAAPVRNSTPSH